MPALVTSSISERALLLLEIIASTDDAPTLNELIAAAKLPKATVHRFAALLERLGFAQRSLDGKRYEVGHRLTSLAVQAMHRSFHTTHLRAILTTLVKEVGETCNITMLDGMKLVYLDRVESDWPLQYRLRVGSHVPLHCTASGKLFLSLTPPSLRQSLYQSGGLERHTPRTITTARGLETALARIGKTQVGTDNEEFIEGMTAIAVPIRDAKGRICATVAVHGPATRLSMKRATSLAPALRKAARTIEENFVTPKARPGK
jgi:DNA-binding IclR family transcriptional regulator